MDLIAVMVHSCVDVFADVAVALPMTRISAAMQVAAAPSKHTQVHPTTDHASPPASAPIEPLLVSTQN
jgi:hypothetical protein